MKFLLKGFSFSNDLYHIFYQILSQSFMVVKNKKVNENKHVSGYHNQKFWRYWHWWDKNWLHWISYGYFLLNYSNCVIFWNSKNIEKTSKGEFCRLLEHINKVFISYYHSIFQYTILVLLALGVFFYGWLALLCNKFIPFR